MKKYFILLITFIAVSITTFVNADTYITVNNGAAGQGCYVADTRRSYNAGTGYYTNSRYTIDRWVEQRKAEEQNAQVGIITRFGYAYNYDAFTYGVSLLYHWDGLLGVTLGFDGYKMSGKICAGIQETPLTDIDGNPVVNEDGTIATINTYQVKDLGKGLPLWDARFGLEIGKYFVVGGLLGKTNVDHKAVLNLKGKDAWFINNTDNSFMYGGFVTFILPICSYVGINMDFAVTNKTGFNIAAGVNFTLPLKYK